MLIIIPTHSYRFYIKFNSQFHILLKANQLGKMRRVEKKIFWCLNMFI